MLRRGSSGLPSHQQAACVLRHGLEQVVPGLPVAADPHHHQRVLDQVRQRRERVLAGHRLDRLQRRTCPEDAHHPEEPPLLVGEQTVVQSRVARIVRCRSGRSRAVEVASTSSTRASRVLGASSRRCAQASSIASGRPARRWRSARGRPRRPRRVRAAGTPRVPGREPATPRATRRAPPRSAGPWAAGPAAVRRTPARRAAAAVSGSTPARSARAERHEAAHVGGCAQQVLEVVEDQEQALRLQVLGEHLERVRAVAGHQAERAADREHDGVGLGQRGQRDPDHPVRVLHRQRLRHRDCQPGLADTARPREGDQPVARPDHRLDGGDVLVPPVQAGRREHEPVAHRGRGRGHGGCRRDRRGPAARDQPTRAARSSSDASRAAARERTVCG